MKPGSHKSALRNEVFLGTWLSLGSPTVAELAAVSGFDWLLFDQEHGHRSEAALPENLRAVRGTGTQPIVRVGAPHPDAILRALDWGAVGIMAPHIETADQARACVEAMHFPPRGRRGLSRSARSFDYGLRPPAEVPPPLFFAQIESARGVEAAPEIAAIEGVDVLFVGPADLAHDLSVRGPRAPAYDRCLAHVAEAARGAGKRAGILVRKADDLPRLRTLGYAYLAIDSDLAILRQRYQALLALAREHASNGVAEPKTQAAG